MKTLEYLADPTLRSIYLPGMLAGALAVFACGLLSPLVVVKRLGFIGQGISHSAFGGIGVASLLAAWGWIDSGGRAEFAVVVAFCAIAAWGMGALSRPTGGRRVDSEDTTIGLFLVGSMALGAILVQVARESAQAAGHPGDVRSWESILFGSVGVTSDAELRLAASVALLVALAGFLFRRPLLFWAADEDAAAGFGVPTRATRAGLMLTLALVVVTTMKVAGVVLATALLVLPGATALRLSSRLWAVAGLSVAIGLLGVGGGFVLAFEQGWQPGPCIVAAMVAIYGLALGVSKR